MQDPRVLEYEHHAGTLRLLLQCSKPHGQQEGSILGSPGESGAGTKIQERDKVHCETMVYLIENQVKTRGISPVSIIYRRNKMTEILYEKNNVRIYQDTNPEDPREVPVWIGTIVTWHRLYSLGDIQPKEDPEEFKFQLACHVDAGLEEFQERFDTTYFGMHQQMQETIANNIQTRLNKALESYVILPVYLYDHSGLTIRTVPFSCPWDSGQLGFIFCLKANAEQEGINDIEKCLRHEIEIYNQYLCGECLGYIKNEDEKESCWGFYGYTPEELANEVLNGEV